MRSDAYLRFAAVLAALGGAPGAAAAAGAQPAVAQVGEELARSEEYTLYAKILIQIDLLANPNTAYLPITVSTLRSGQILLDGQVPTARMREHVLQTARRISGLNVGGNIEVADVKPDLPGDLSAEDLEMEIQATITGFYPEHSDRIRTTVKQGGVVELNGDVDSYETKLNVSRIVKSQPGCKAVVNLLHVPAEPESGLVHVTEDGQLRLEASRLPIIPAAPIAMLTESERDHPRLRSIMTPLADDSPTLGRGAARLVEDARAVVSRDSKLSSFELALEAEGGGVVASGRIEKQADVEYVVEALAEIPEVKKVVVKSRPISMMRTYPAHAKSKTSPAPPTWTERLKDWLPFSGDSDDPVRMSHGFRFRSSVQKSLNKGCQGRVGGLKVKSIPRGLLIEGEVSSARDRAFVFKQVDNLVELNAVPVDVVLRIKE